MSVNFSQLRRRQSSREILYRTQISRSEEAEEGAAGGAAAGGDDGGIRDEIRLNFKGRFSIDSLKLHLTVQFPISHKYILQQ